MQTSKSSPTKARKKPESVEELVTHYPSVFPHDIDELIVA